MNCSLFGKGNIKNIHLPLYWGLHRDGRELIDDWAQRGCKADNAFEGFIYSWLAVNGWGACVADTDTDRQWVDAVAADADLNAAFRGLFAENKAFRAASEGFASLWPIFESRHIRRKQIYMSPDIPRQDRIALYLDHGLESYEPSCWKEHKGGPPVDWAHTFKTLYRVRCNLFHGEKAMMYDNDRQVVQSAFAVLCAFIEGTGVLG